MKRYKHLPNNTYSRRIYYYQSYSRYNPFSTKRAVNYKYRRQLKIKRFTTDYNKLPKMRTMYDNFF